MENLLSDDKLTPLSKQDHSDIKAVYPSETSPYKKSISKSSKVPTTQLQSDKDQTVPSDDAQTTGAPMFVIESNYAPIRR